MLLYYTHCRSMEGCKFHMLMRVTVKSQPIYGTGTAGHIRSVYEAKINLFVCVIS